MTRPTQATVERRRTGFSSSRAWSHPGTTLSGSASREATPPAVLSFDRRQQSQHQAPGAVRRGAGVGLCYAKSHLLVAVARAAGVPAGLCYQQLTDGGEPFLHGLVAVYLAGSWHRQDPRGNRTGIDAQFRLGREQLAYPISKRSAGIDFPEVRVRPSPNVIAALRGARDALELCRSGLPATP
jgi:hypothetical protein